MTDKTSKFSTLGGHLDEWSEAAREASIEARKANAEGKEKKGPEGKAHGAAEGKKEPKLEPHEKAFLDRIKDVPKGASKKEILAAIGVKAEEAISIAKALKEKLGGEGEGKKGHGGEGEGKKGHGGEGEHEGPPKKLFAPLEHSAYKHHEGHFLEIIHLLTGSGGEG